MTIDSIVGVNGTVDESIIRALEKATYVGIDFGTSTTTVTRME